MLKIVVCTHTTTANPFSRHCSDDFLVIDIVHCHDHLTCRRTGITFSYRPSDIPAGTVPLEMLGRYKSPAIRPFPGDRAAIDRQLQTCYSCTINISLYKYSA